MRPAASPNSSLSGSVRSLWRIKNSSVCEPTAKSLSIASSGGIGRPSIQRAKPVVEFKSSLTRPALATSSLTADKTYGRTMAPAIGGRSSTGNGPAILA